MARNLIVVSGYYGFDNLGDEAILEELLVELSQFASREEIVVLSNAPGATARKYGVTSVDRWQMSGIMKVMARARLFISGGGGLFQDSQSAGSVIYYGGLICLARMLGTKTMIYAQGLGPLRRPVSKFCTKAVFNLADQITLRDAKSMALLQSWGLNGHLTEDPVWLLKAGPLSESLKSRLVKLKEGKGPLVGLSLRQGGGFSRAHIEALAETFAAALPEGAVVIGLPLQKELDEPALAIFAERFQELGHTFNRLDFKELSLPSQWLTLIGGLDIVVGMRLHSLIMALSAGVPVVGIAYDPKVSRILEQFEQANLTYEREAESISATEKDDWLAILRRSVQERAAYSKKASQEASRCRELACQNPLVMAKILA
ncbi:MAG: polysaccharide pyruvyl transferase CsaB [Cyanobacteria bacterium REEB67]|nr:polysaccharide pyruvyl transferase CsaB [Cyanobacteria bacterium REEB67]